MTVTKRKIYGNTPQMRWFSTDFPSQLGYFREVDTKHYDWQTDRGYFAITERELLQAASIPTAGTLLEIGCGEGANLFHLGAKRGWVGLDFAKSKLSHANTKLPGVSFACGDAGALPFKDEAFDTVLIRDLLHHVPDRNRVVSEAARVLVSGGTLAVIEPNRNHPLIIAQALAVKAERAVLQSTASRMCAELAVVGLENVSVTHAQPFPVARVLLHPRLGTAKYGNNAKIRALLRGIDKVAQRLVSPTVWMYLMGRAQKPIHTDRK